MAVVAPSSPDTQEPRPAKSDQETPSFISQDASPLSAPATSAPPAAAAAAAPAGVASGPATENPSSLLAGPSNLPVMTPPPPSMPSFTPSFRPVGAPAVPQYTPLANPNLPNPAYPSPGLQPPGVSVPPVHNLIPVAAPGGGAMPVPVPSLQPPGVYQAPPGQMPSAAPGSYVPTPNGYLTIPTPVPQGPPAIPPPGIPRYPTPYPTMVRPGFPPRPLGAPIGVIPALPRPPIQGLRGVPPIVPPIMRPAIPGIAPTEKPQTTVYVGKIASTVENEFLESLLRLCGPVKSWKRVENPSDGTFRGFGFCEFESAEGVLRALRLLSKLNVDGQELVLNVNQATREYLERYVEKKTQREKLNESDVNASEKENSSPSATEKPDSTMSAVESSDKIGEESGDKEKQDTAQTFGIVNDEDRDADKDALEKLTNMIGERLKNKPLPPPPPVDNTNDAAKSNSEAPSKSRDGDSDVDIMKNGEDKKEEEMTSDTRPAADHDRSETSSSDKTRRRDRSRERDRERDLKREKERELERYERERERERVRREREREIKIREADRLYKDHVKEWEAREREKESQRQREIDREKERARERRREIKDQENDSDDDDTRKRRHRSSVIEEKRRKRQREKEEDLIDRLREEEEIAEAKRRAIEEDTKQKENNFSDQVNEERHDLVPDEEMVTEDEHAVTRPYEDENAGDGALPNGSSNEIHTDFTAASDAKQGNNISSRKLGFGLMASGKRATVPSVFHEEDDDMEKEKKMRPLVPIDYSTEELQAVQAAPSGTPPNLAAAAEFAKRITSVNSKEDKPDMERERNKRSSERTGYRDRNRDDEEHTRTRDDGREKSHDKIPHRSRESDDKVKTVENKKLLDAKQLIDMIPKTKEKLFAYEINWDVYDKHELHERMRPWISKKITEFLGEEEATLVDYIVSSTREHVHASQMLELLQSILDDEAEMFVLKMWRMLIFEIKKVETGLNLKSKA